MVLATLFPKKDTPPDHSGAIAFEETADPIIRSVGRGWRWCYWGKRNV